MTITYSIGGPLTAEEAADLLSKDGFARPLDDLARVQRMLDNADVLITARDGERLAGFVRALSDFAYYCFVAELAVEPDYQRRGIGKDLLLRLREATGAHVNMVLTASEGADTYYPHLGWERVNRSWRLRRAR